MLVTNSIYPLWINYLSFYTSVFKAVPDKGTAYSKKTRHAPQSQILYPLT